MLYVYIGDTIPVGWLYRLVSMNQHCFGNRQAFFRCRVQKRRVFPFRPLADEHDNCSNDNELHAQTNPHASPSYTQLNVGLLSLLDSRQPRSPTTNCAPRRILDALHQLIPRARSPGIVRELTAHARAAGANSTRTRARPQSVGGGLDSVLGGGG